MARSGNCSWRQVYRAAAKELVPARKMELCRQCRELIQRQMTDHSVRLSKQDQETLEEALRSLWVMEQEVRNPKIQ